jgi:hypothetical protein
VVERYFKIEKRDAKNDKLFEDIRSAMLKK